MKKTDIARTAVRKAAALIKEFIFFPGCAICGRALFSGKEALNGLCSGCAGNFPTEAVPRCPLCGKPLISEKEICVSCRQSPVPFAFDKAVVLYPYTGRYKKLLAAHKFEGRKELAVFLAQKLLEAAELLQIEGRRIWVPVPPRAGKIRSSGRDQIEEIASVLEKADSFDLNTGAEPGNIIVERALVRLASGTQKTLNAGERRDNLRGKIKLARRFAGCPSGAASGGVRQFIIFDDVFTTGSTLSACARVLKENGADKVFALSLFYN